MLRSTGSKSARRFMATAAEGVQRPSKQWAGEPHPSLSIGSSKIRSAVLEGVEDKAGPPSLKSRRARLRYTPPAGLNEAFDLSYAYLKNHAQKKHIQALHAESEAEKTQFLVEAEINNPEVRYNFEFNEKYDNLPHIIDYTQPVYRALKKEHWEGYSQMLLMQRLEQLAIIPDTLPTLEPKAEVSLKFINHTSVNRWIEPGMLLSSNATMYPPSIKIQEYDMINTSEQLYTILIVNPDVADVENNTYKTHLQWGLTNIKLGYNDNFITPSRLLADESINELIDYCPPVPEKNLPKQRFAVWVFRQPSEIVGKIVEREFDIRKYVAKNGLEAIGAHAWRSVWDMNVPKVRQHYGMDEGVVFHKVRGEKRM